MIESDRTAILALLSRWQRHWLESTHLTKQKTEIEAQIATAAGGMVNAEAGLKVFGYDVSEEGVWQKLSNTFYHDLVTFMAQEDAANLQQIDDLDKAIKGFNELLANEDAKKKPPMPSIRDIALMRLREAGEQGSRAKSIRDYIQSTYGVETHEKTVGMTLYRLFKEGKVSRKGHYWFFVQPVAETKNPGVSAPGPSE